MTKTYKFLKLTYILLRSGSFRGLHPRKRNLRFEGLLSLIPHKIRKVTVQKNPPFWREFLKKFYQSNHPPALSGNKNKEDEND